MIFKQRNNIIFKKEALNYADDFLDEIISNLTEHKKKHIISSKNSDFINQIKILSGKAFNDDEIKLLEETNVDNFSNRIKERFKLKRDERIKLLGSDQAEQIEKTIFLQLIDQNWKMHIQYLEQLRQVIGLRSYGQRDPLIEYKKEAFTLFENLLNKLKSDLITILFNLKIVEKKENANQNQISKKNLERFANKKIGRNEPCTCNSGKKFKHCCGAL